MLAPRRQESQDTLSRLRPAISLSHHARSCRSVSKSISFSHISSFGVCAKLAGADIRGQKSRSWSDPQLTLAGGSLSFGVEVNRYAEEKVRA
jgi:hypothetical protein